MIQRILVTGGAGFIGSHLVDALLAKNYEVLVIDDLSTGSKANLDARAKFKKLDIRKPELARVVKEFAPDAIFHLAALASVPNSLKDPIADAEVNLHATLRLLELAAEIKVKRFIFAATGGALSSEKTKLPTDEAHAGIPQSPYAISKTASELYGHFYRAFKQVPFTSFRFANVYGPRQSPHGEAGVVAIFCKRMLANEFLKINGTGKQTRDYVYVGDVVAALMAGLVKPKAEGPFHVGTGKETDVNFLFKALARLTKYSQKAQKGPADAQAPKRSCLDSRKVQKELGWKPKLTLEQGLKQTVEWFDTTSV